jgi:glycosyltransferase involved in cell wall biosynthesis
MDNKQINFPRIAVLMCTYNGGLHLQEQLDSIRNQKHDYIDMWVSDDGSTDATLEILNQYKASWKKGCFVIKKGPQKGFAANFLSLVLDSQIQADFYAFSDQDDIWKKDKLTRAMSFFDGNKSVPTLYCSRTNYVAECGTELGQLSPYFVKKASFANALVQSLAGGNTMVLNKEARDLICQAGEQNIISHDWWIYLLVSGAHGDIYYDKTPYVNYRQHEGNLVGANNSITERFKRVKSIFKGTFQGWNEIHVKALGNCYPLLSPTNQRLLDEFTIARNGTLSQKIKFLKKKAVYRQTRSGNIGLFLALILNKF